MRYISEGYLQNVSITYELTYLCLYKFAYRVFVTTVVGAFYCSYFTSNSSYNLQSMVQYKRDLYVFLNVISLYLLDVMSWVSTFMGSGNKRNKLEWDVNLSHAYMKLSNCITPLNSTISLLMHGYVCAFAQKSQIRATSVGARKSAGYITHHWKTILIVVLLGYGITSLVTLVVIGLPKKISFVG